MWRLLLRSVPRRLRVNPHSKNQLSTVNCQLPTVNCQLPTANCQLSTVNCQLSTVNCQLPTVNCQLPTVNCQLPTVNCLSAIELGNSVQNLRNNYHISSYCNDLICQQEAARTAPPSSPTTQEYNGGL
jgi:hypothetical protein